MSAESLQAWTFGLQVVNTVLLPVVIGMARFLWRVDRRLLVIELHLGLHGKRAPDN